jgi:hypothetical protein
MVGDDDGCGGTDGVSDSNSRDGNSGASDGGAPQALLPANYLSYLERGCVFNYLTAFPIWGGV